MKKAKTKNGNTANLGFEAKLWAAAAALRNNMDAAEYKHVVLGGLGDRVIRGIDAQIVHGDTFHNDRHPDLKADYVLATPPFNDSDWRGELQREDKGWKYDTPPAGCSRRSFGNV